MALRPRPTRYCGLVRKTAVPILRLFFILVLLKELLTSAWFFRTSIPSATPVRSLTRCAEPTALGFIPRYFSVGHGNKMPVRLFTLVCMSKRTCHRSRSRSYIRTPAKNYKGTGARSISRGFSPLAFSAHCRKSPAALLRSAAARACAYAVTISGSDRDSRIGSGS